MALAAPVSLSCLSRQLEAMPQLGIWRSRRPCPPRPGRRDGRQAARSV